ncbi:MAG: glycosyltransferase family 4 protein [Candidatus Kerfeldbacteria bacterium]|nr:glycosyltransferase family 4 protein [Candidatus Kerfeldbacteria bacterium]
MRIGIDARFYGGEQSKGLGRYTQKLIEHLAAYDHTNEYVVFLQQDGFNAWNIPNNNFTPVLAPYRWYTFREQLLMPLKIRAANVDLMHFPHFNVPLLYGWLRPFIVTVHDLIILHFPTERATTLGPLLYTIKHLAGKLVMRHAVKQARHILTVSEFSKQDIMSYYHLPAEKIQVTYEAAEPVSAHLTAAEITKVLEKYDISKPYLLYVGNVYPHKNLEVVIDLLAELKKRGTPPLWHIVLVGREDYFYKRLKAEARAKNIDEYIVFTDFVPDDELPALYTNAQAYIFPSHYEGFGLPALEAMSYGTPVLAARSSCLPEILGDAALYFDPNDISGIINAVERIMNDEHLRAHLIQASTTQLRQYSWKTMMQRTWQIYQDAIHDK